MLILPLPPLSLPIAALLGHAAAAERAPRRHIEENDGVAVDSFVDAMRLAGHAECSFNNELQNKSLLTHRKIEDLNQIEIQLRQ